MSYCERGERERVEVRFGESGQPSLLVKSTRGIQLSSLSFTIWALARPALLFACEAWIRTACSLARPRMTSQCTSGTRFPPYTLLSTLYAIHTIHYANAALTLLLSKNLAILGSTKRALFVRVRASRSALPVCLDSPQRAVKEKNSKKYRLTWLPPEPLHQDSRFVL